MTEEIVGKIEQILGVSPLREADVQHLFALARKLTEITPKTDRPKYTLLTFYCDWTLHSKIDRSEAGAKILTQIHELVVQHLKKVDNSSFAADLSAALSLDKVRDELNNLIVAFGGVANAAGLAKWREVVPALAEIISQAPLKIAPKNSILAALLRTIRSQPLKGTSVVEELAIVKIPSTTFNEKAPAEEFTYCIKLTTTDTTRIITPLMRT